MPKNLSQVISVEVTVKDYMVERVLTVGGYIKETHQTIRETAKKFGYSKSTIHNDVSYRLRKIDPKLYQETKKILEANFADKHNRGGQSTKRKYAHQCE